MNVLETALVRLEPQRAVHAEAMFEVLSDPAIYEHEQHDVGFDEMLLLREAVIALP